VENKIFELADKYKALRDRKIEAEATVKRLTEKIETAERDLIAAMTQDEVQNFTHSGASFSLAVRELISPRPERKTELYTALKDNGYDSLFTVNANTLQATVKELKEQNGDALPGWLDGLVAIYEKPSIRLSAKR
jgi:hypothetical protein